MSRVSSFADLLYGHVHIYDRDHDFGDVTTTKIQYFEVWSAYSSSKVLNPITASNADGVYLSSLGNYTTEGFVPGAPQTPPSLPTTYQPGESRKYSITAGVNGAAVILGSFTFVFSGAESPVVTFEGNRVTLLMGAANWRDPVIERISYLTDISSPVSGNEQRRSLLRSPRRKYSYTITPRTPREGAMIRSVIWGSQVKRVLAPEWPEQTITNAAASIGAASISVTTTGRDFIDGGFAVLYSDFETFEIVQILVASPGAISLVSGLTRGWPAHAKIVPCRYARMDQVLQSAQHTSDVSEISMSLEVDPVNSPNFSGGYAYPYSYRGYNVFMEKNNDADLLNNKYGRNTTVLDNRTGIYAYTQWATYPYLNYSYSFLKGTRSRITEFRKFIEDCRGRFKPFWMPSWQKDIDLISISGVTVIIKDAGLARYVGLNPAMRDIALIKPDMTTLFRRVSAAVNNGDGTETITVDSSLSVSAADIYMTSFLRFCRLDSDEIALQWETNETVTSNLPIRLLAAA